MFGKLINTPSIRRLTRKYSAEAAKKYKLKAEAWQIHNYGEISELQKDSVRTPIIQSPDDVLVQVEAASINPIDLAMLGGYGRTLIQIPRKFNMELPLILGRDFAGTIIHKGQNIDDSFKVGDKVYGFKPLHENGTFSQVISVNKDHFTSHPEHLKVTESASLVYASMTAWCALYIFGPFMRKSPKGQKALILGASGGVGTVAVQLLKSQGCEVVATCSTDAMPLVQSLNADMIVDYKDPNYAQTIENLGSYVVVLDCARIGYENLPKNWKFEQYVALNSPLLLNTDAQGLVGGLLTSVNSLMKVNCQSAGQGKQVRWGFFLPVYRTLLFLDKLIKERKINPVIHKEFDFDKLPDAFSEVKAGHLRGKVVVKF